MVLAARLFVWALAIRERARTPKSVRVPGLTPFGGGGMSGANHPQTNWRANRCGGRG
ncbi:hypothetical protein FTUN_5479 [Frigoriglobus tundricola]|uniref:Uncharacterized protein n=1 Tax=Frigoriglobus tundricola TaxID=2774151 RepID=A0A6M5YVC8_9BACT|nr:hypothetical protein FTUN_5479 [Frigoriglobus tundricola]